MNIPTFYVEREIADHPRSQQILQKFPNARVIPIERYSEVFNRKNQSFRAQKEQGKVFILAKKVKHFIQTVPFNYSLQTPHNFYFSHLYNCPYDCEYCYLQGMYRSAYFVVFVNYEDFETSLKEQVCECLGEMNRKEITNDKLRMTHRTNNDSPSMIHDPQSKMHHSSLQSENPPSPLFQRGEAPYSKLFTQNPQITFFSGYDCDSLAMEHITGFAEHFVPFFETVENAQMELRTKSANIQSLLKMPVAKNTFVTWTLSPEEIWKQWERKTASLSARVKALGQLQSLGWRVVIRLEPVIHFAGWRESYTEFFEYLEEHIDFSQVENIGWGHFRLPKENFKTMKKMLPQSTLLTKHYELRDSGEMSYSRAVEEEMTRFFLEQCRALLPDERIVYYRPEDHS